MIWLRALRRAIPEWRYAWHMAVAEEVMLAVRLRVEGAKAKGKPVDYQVVEVDVDSVDRRIQKAKGIKR